MSIGAKSIGGGGIGETTSFNIVFDATSNSGYQAAASTYNWNHTCSGADRYLVVGIAMLSLAQTVSGITYNSVALSLLGTKASITGAARVELWGLVAPSTGVNSIAVTLTGAIASAGLASSYNNVHQTVPTEAFNSAQATNVGAADATVDVTTVADYDWTVDIVATDDTAITVGAGQVERGNVTGAGGSGAMSSEADKTPAGAVTMSWTNIGALSTWAIGSIALRPRTAAGASAVYQDAWQYETNFYSRIRRGKTTFNLPKGCYEANPAQIGIFYTGAWADPDDVFAYRKPNGDFWMRAVPVYEANPATIKIFYTDSWSDPAYFYQYHRPTKNDAWVNVKPILENNPAQLGIFYQDSWSDPAVVYPYKRPVGNYWTKVNGDYEPNTNTIGIYFDGAWEPQAHVYPYRARPKFYSMLPEVIEHEPFVIKITYAGAWTGNEVNQTKYYRKRNWLQEFYTVDSIAMQRRIEMTYNEAFTESGIATDTLANVVIYNVTFVDTGAASDILSAAITLFDGTFKGREYGASTTLVTDASATYGKGREFGTSTSFTEDAATVYPKGRNYD